MTSALDHLMPTWDVAGEHRIAIKASPEIVYQKVRELDMGNSWGIRLLFRLRGLPPNALTIGGLQNIRFALLADDPPHELVLGIIGQFWTPSGNLKRTDAADFVNFSEPGYAKAAWNFRVQPNGSHVVLTTETRVMCLGEASRRSFRRYWKVIRPLSGWIRRRALRIIKDAAECSYAPEAPVQTHGDSPRR